MMTDFSTVGHDALALGLNDIRSPTVGECSSGNRKHGNTTYNPSYERRVR